MIRTIYKLRKLNKIDNKNKKSSKLISNKFIIMKGKFNGE